MMTKVNNKKKKYKKQKKMSILEHVTREHEFYFKK
jgi:hypothetical protein